MLLLKKSTADLGKCKIARIIDQTESVVVSLSKENTVQSRAGWQQKDQQQSMSLLRWCFKLCILLTHKLFAARYDNYLILSAALRWVS